MKSAKLTLIPTPISDELDLCPTAKSLLLGAVEKNELILVEEHKIARRRWLQYGLPREAIENFVLYNEHTVKECAPEILKELKNGRNAYLMSDCGMPAFCDPGRDLVELCHRAKIKVTSAPFANSIALAVALSGFDHSRFIFEGFIPARSTERSKELKRILSQNITSIIMDTPYRLSKIIDEIIQVNPNKEICIALDLNSSEEEILRNNALHFKNKFNGAKREFVIVIGK